MQLTINPLQSYPCIIQPDNVTNKTMNLPLYRDVRKEGEGAALGEIMDLREMCRFFGFHSVDQILTDERWKLRDSDENSDVDDDDQEEGSFCVVENED